MALYLNNDIERKTMYEKTTSSDCSAVTFGFEHRD